MKPVSAVKSVAGLVKRMAFKFEARPVLGWIHNMTRLQRLLVWSLSANLLVVGLTTFIAYRKGGVSWLHQVAVSAFQPAPAPLRAMDKPLYRAHTDIHAALPRGEAAIIFAGDSLISSVDWKELLQIPALNRGIGGDTVEGLRLRLDEILEHHPRQLFVMIGINNLVRAMPTDDMWIEYQKLISFIRTVSPQTQLFLQSVLPVNQAMLEGAMPPDVAAQIIRVNRALKEAADGQHIIYIDVHSHMVDKDGRLNMHYTVDGIHLNGAGYLKWRDVLRPFLPS